jgi:hypothetical protein
MTCGSRLGVAALALVLLATGGARAHDPGLSDLSIVFDSHHVEASWWIDQADLAGSEPQASGSLHLESGGAAAALADGGAKSTWDGHRHLTFEWKRSAGDPLRLSAPLLDQLPLGHRVLVRVIAPDGAMREIMLSAREPAVDLGR